MPKAPADTPPNQSPGRDRQTRDGAFHARASLRAALSRSHGSVPGTRSTVNAAALPVVNDAANGSDLVAARLRSKPPATVTNRRSLRAYSAWVSGCRSSRSESDLTDLHSAHAVKLRGSLFRAAAATGRERSGPARRAPWARPVPRHRHRTAARPDSAHSWASSRRPCSAVRTPGSRPSSGGCCGDTAQFDQPGGKGVDDDGRGNVLTAVVTRVEHRRARRSCAPRSRRPSATTIFVWRCDPAGPGPHRRRRRRGGFCLRSRGPVRGPQPSPVRCRLRRDACRTGRGLFLAPPFSGFVGVPVDLAEGALDALATFDVSDRTRTITSAIEGVTGYLFAAGVGLPRTGS